jgi:hypothetical protein
VVQEVQVLEGHQAQVATHSPGQCLEALEATWECQAYLEVAQQAQPPTMTTALML